jgi:hypothetical protein
MALLQPQAGERIADLLSRAPLHVQKRIQY